MLARLLLVTALGLERGPSSCGLIGDGASSRAFDGEGVVFIRPKENVRPAFFKEKTEEDLGSGGLGMSVNGLSCGDCHGFWLLDSVEDAIVDAALSRDELPTVDAVLLFERPLPLINC